MSTWREELTRAVAQARGGDPAGAAAAVQAALRDPAVVAQGLLDGGRFLFQAGRPDLAELVFAALLARSPDHLDGLHDGAVAALALGQPDRALDRLDRFLAAQPGSVLGLGNRGHALRALGRMDEARVSFRQAAELAPRDPNALNNLALACLALEDAEGAVDALQALLAVRPDATEPRGLLAQTAVHLGRFSLALDILQEGLRRHPGHPGLLQELALLLQAAGFHDLARPKLEALWRGSADPAVLSAVLFATLHDPLPSAAEVFERHRAWARRFASPIPPPPPAVRAADRPLRVGLVSPDLHQHPVAAFLEPLLRHHDRAALELTVFSLVPGGDAATARLRQLAPAWVDLFGLGPAAAEQRVRAAGLDMLVDLAGHTSRALLDLFARRPAQLQATWLGYPASTGMDVIDLRITDAVADPEGAEAVHSEALLRVPGGFLCHPEPPGLPAPGPLPARAAGHLTFGCFNKLSKLNGPVLDLWCAVLRRVPDSRLVLKARPLADPGVRTAWIDAFAERGVPESRLNLLAATATQAEHLELHRQLDIALDPFPYNGTTTSCEALWMGVPVLTLRGDRHAARVGASLLTQVGLSDWIAETAADFLARAAEKAADLDALSTLRAGLPARCAATLGNGPDFARRFAEALRRAWADHGRPAVAN